jgi:adenosylcobyric acid synthase
VTPAGGGLLVAGTCSDAGKTTVVAGLCRVLARRGVRVAPFKAQNMSLNSGVTAAGHEIARAQMLQAQAAGVKPDVAMNPVLIKPAGHMRSNLVVMGRPAGEIGAADYTGSRRVGLLEQVVAAYTDLRSRYDVVIAEGAGSPAEVNLRDGDIANMGLAQAVGLPVVVVGDIDRGGVFASLVGTLACLSVADRRLVRGFIVNKFRGDLIVLRPGLDDLERRTGLPVYGVLPYDENFRLDAEDSLSTQWSPVPEPALGPDILRVAVVRLPFGSNLTDLEPLAAEPGVIVTFASVPQQLDGVDVVIVPGTRATVEDMRWLVGRGFAPVLRARAAAELPVFGICGGYQMLGERIDDDIESRAGSIAGLGLLPVTTQFYADKTLAVRRADLPDGTVVTGYEIRQGVVARHGGNELLPDEGCRQGSVGGTSWHGLFDSDGYRRQFLASVAASTGRRFVVSDMTWARRRERQLEQLADLMEQHVDCDTVAQLAGAR